MLHVVLDSSIYRADQKRKSNPFRALTRLAKTHKLALHVPYFIKREVVTQQQITIDVAVNEVRRAADTILRTSGVSEITAYATSTDAKAADFLGALKTLVSDDFDKWLTDVDAEVYTLSVDHTQAVADAYFKGDLPFRKQKSREDIPDAFIWQSILDIVKENGKVHVVTNDQGLFATADAHPDVIAHHKLDEFIQTSEFQDAIKETSGDILEENIDRVQDLLPNHTNAFSLKVKSLLAKELIARRLKDDDLPGYETEASIIEVSDPSDITFSFEAASYYGELQIGIPFETTLDCVLEYALYQGEFYRLSASERRHMRVEARNEHYYGIEQDHCTSVTGVLTLQLLQGRLGDITLTDPDLERLISTSAQSISVTEVELEW